MGGDAGRDGSEAVGRRRQVTVPRSFAGLTRSSFYVPAHDASLRRAVEWSIDPPFEARAGEPFPVAAAPHLSAPLS